MATDERCWADWIDCTLDCELPAGHEGDHQATMTWPQAEPVPGPPVAISPGWQAFIQDRYGAVING